MAIQFFPCRGGFWVGWEKDIKELMNIKEVRKSLDM